MKGIYASPPAFDRDFRINAAIIVFFENIQDAEKVKVEGKTDNIEITLGNHRKIYVQAKDDSQGNEKLNEALGTLNEAAKIGNGQLFTYVTNVNTFDGDSSHMHFEELPVTAQEKIKDILREKGYNAFDVNKLDIRVIPYHGEEQQYETIKTCINDYLRQIDIPEIDEKLIQIWQNATMADLSIAITKEKLIWPLIVLVADKVEILEVIKGIDEERAEEINAKYQLIINQNMMDYQVYARIMSGFRQARKSIDDFVATQWDQYLDLVEAVAEDTKEILVKIILHRTLMRTKSINTIKKEVNL